MIICLNIQQKKNLPNAHCVEHFRTEKNTLCMLILNSKSVEYVFILRNM